VRSKLLFDTVPVRDQSSADPGFRIDFRGELSIGDVILPDVVEAAHWIAEIDYDCRTGVLKLAVEPTRTALRDAPVSEGFRFTICAGTDKGPSFRSRILQRSNRIWEPSIQGIRVFMEGFRVPPYGEQTDDWLDLERDYKSRTARQLISLQSIDIEGLPPGLDTEELVLQGNAAHFGGIFLYRSTSPGLTMLINREGFLPGPEFDFVKTWVRIATDLIVRLGYAARQEVKLVRKEQRDRQKRAAKQADVSETPTSLRVRESAMAAQRELDVVREALKRGQYEAASKAAQAVQPHIADVRALSDEFGSEAVMWRVLASLGTELAAFVHEINALALEARGIVFDLDEALAQAPSRTGARAIRNARRRALDLADRIKRNAAYLVDATSFEGRRRRSRQPLRARFEAVLPFFQTRVVQRHIALENAIPADLRTPPMFPSELTGIFVNLLSNAVKFAGEHGRIRVEATVDPDNMTFKMQNTGAPVNLRTAQKLFEAFHSTTIRPDAVLGQGMGMGLTITRAFVQEYGGEIGFVPPSTGFATAIMVSIPAR
jgi:signal transduction histidine kinase